MENSSAQRELLKLCRPFKVISLIGLCKSAGKTTVLTKLIHGYQREGYTPPLAITSVGQGGLLPEIRFYAGMYAATAAGLLSECDYTRRIIHTTGINTPLGEVIVTEALTDGRVSLAGPSISSQLEALCQYLLEDVGAGQVFVDGAGDRRTFAMVSGGSILCAGAALNRDIRGAARQCAHICRLMSLPAAASVPEDKAQSIRGALTDQILTEITDNTDKKEKLVIAEDASKIFVSAAVLDRFLHKGGGLFVENPANLIGITVNPVAPTYVFDREEFFEAVRELVDVPVFDVVNYYH